MNWIEIANSGTASRRAVLGGALATGALLAARPLPVWAQQMQTYLPPGVAPKPKGPLIFLDYDKEELDYAYEQAPWLSNREAVAARGRQLSEAANARLGPPRDIAYGPTEVEKLYLSATRQANAPINVYIHGGAWRSIGARRDYLREIFFDAGAHFITVGFTNVVETSGNLMPLADQVRRAVAWVYRNAANFGGNPEQVYVSGHSSGGHLAAVVLTTDWQNDYGLPMDIVKGGLCCSGMYDLYPVSLSSRNTYVNFTDEIVEALSPQRHLDKLVAPLIVAHGSRETPEFQRQGREFAEAIQSAGKPVSYLVGEGNEHFDIRLTLGNPYGLLGRAVLEQMNL
jgi:arylformamidase